MWRTAAPFVYYGATQFRLPQVRYTQKFGEYFDASLEIGSPQNGRWGLNVNSADPLEGEISEVPMVEGKLRYEQDLYGKAGLVRQAPGLLCRSGRWLVSGPITRPAILIAA